MNIVYEALVADEIPNVIEMILETFDKYVGSGYTEQGIVTFRNFVKPEALLERYKNVTDFMLVAKVQEQIIGVISLRDKSHISLFFVKEDYHGRGVGRELLDRVLEKLEVKQKGITKITVNSSPYAVKVYERLGFTKTEEEKEVDGIVFVPMECYLGVS